MQVATGASLANLDSFLGAETMVPVDLMPRMRGNSMLGGWYWRAVEIKGVHPAEHLASFGAGDWIGRSSIFRTEVHPLRASPLLSLW